MDYKSLSVLSVLLGLVPAMIAYDKGRNFWKWWFFGAALFPAALPMAILLKSNTRVQETNQLVLEGMKKCLYCAEIIRAEAVVCQFCGRDLLGHPGLAETYIPVDTLDNFKVGNIEVGHWH